MKSRFGIGINDERIPSGLMGKTTFAKKFEASFRNPVLDTLFRNINTIMLNDRCLNFFYHNRFSLPFQGIKNLVDWFVAKIEQGLILNHKEAMLLFHGINGSNQFRSVMGDHLISILEKYIMDWHLRQKYNVRIPPPKRKTNPPPKTYRGWKKLREEFQPNWDPIPADGQPVKILLTDSLTPLERMRKLVAGKPTDRIGFGPSWDYAVAYLGGSNIWEFCYDGIATGLACVNTWLRCGGSDWLPSSIGVGAYAIPYPDPHSRYYFKWNLPHDANFPQFLEKRLIESYQEIIDNGDNSTLQEITKRTIRDTIVMFRELYYHGKVINRYFGPIKNQFYPYSKGFISAFDLIPMVRGLIDFSRDVKKKKEEIHQIFEFITKPLTDIMVTLSKLMNAETCMIGCSRGSSTFMSPKDFEETHWKSLKYSINEINKAGMTCTLHLDNNWRGNLHYFVEELPKRSCILHLDQLDLVEAHKITSDHFCLMGAISLPLATRGTPTQLEEKLKTYIKEIGKDGLILASGCEIPVDIPIQNFYAYKKAISRYGRF